MTGVKRGRYGYAVNYKIFMAAAAAVVVSVISNMMAGSRKSIIGEMCLKDFLIHYNHRIAAYMLFPVVTILVLVYLNKMFDINVVIRYVNIRTYYMDLVKSVFVKTAVYMFLILLTVSLLGIMLCGFEADNWSDKTSYAFALYGHRLVNTGIVKLLAAMYIAWFFIVFINFELSIIIHRFVGNLYIGFIITTILNVYVLNEMANDRLISFYVKDFVYISGWNFKSLVLLICPAIVLFIVILFMGRNDFIKRRLG